MQLQTLQDEVRIRAGVDGADAMATDAILTSLINAAIREVSNMRDWDWYVTSETITTVVGQIPYARNAAARKTIRVEDGVSGELLVPVTAEAAARYNDHEGYPALWFVGGGSLHLLPQPSVVRAIKHVYTTSETALSGATDEPLIPDYAIDLVIVKAALKLAARMDNTSMHRLLAKEERDVIDTLQDDARRSKPAPAIDTRRDWYVR